MWAAYGDFYLLQVGSVVYTVSDFVSDDLAAGANCALSQVMHGLERVDQGFGDDVLVQGAEALEFYAVAVAKARGASQVIAVDGVRDRLELATAFGADHVIDLTELTEVKQRVKRVESSRTARAAMWWSRLWVTRELGPSTKRSKMLAQYGRYVEMGNINMESTVLFAPARFVSRTRRSSASRCMSRSCCRVPLRS